MIKTETPENKISLISLPVILGAIAGAFLLTDGHARFLVVALACVFPVILYISQKPLITILKLMLFVVFFIPFHSFDFLNPFKVFNPLVILCLIAAMKLLFGMLARDRKEGGRLTIIDSLYLLFLISASISSLRAVSLFGSLNWLFYSVTTGYVVYRVILTLSPPEIKGLLKFLVLVNALSALYGIGEFLSGHSLIFGTDTAGRLTSMLGHPVMNGLVLATFFPFSVALYLETKQKRYISSSAVIFAAIILTFARGSWLALTIGLLVMFLLSRFYIKIQLLLAVVILVGCLGLIPPVMQLVSKRLHENESNRYSSFTVRREAFPVAFAIIRDRPFFGGGPFNSSWYRERYTIDVNIKGFSLENTYLGLLVDLGLVGAAILAFIYLAVLKKSVFSPWAHSGSDIYRVAAIAGLTILVLNMETFSLEAYRLLHFLAWFSIGLNIVMSGPIENNLSLEQGL